MEVFGDFLAFLDRDRIGFEVMVDRIHHGFCRIIFRQIEMHHLTKGMHPGIGSARNIDAHECTGEFFDRGLKDLLNRNHFVLVLPTVVRAAVIFDGTFIALHHRYNYLNKPISRLYSRAFKRKRGAIMPLACLSTIACGKLTSRCRGQNQDADEGHSV